MLQENLIKFRPNFEKEPKYAQISTSKLKTEGTKTSTSSHFGNLEIPTTNHMLKLTAKVKIGNVKSRIK